MLYSLRFAVSGLEDAAFLLERATLESSGDLESGFLSRAERLRRHPTGGAAALAARLAAEPGTALVVLVRNPELVLDPGLPDRVAAARARLDSLAGPWSLAAAGGLTPEGGRVSALYVSAAPHLRAAADPRPLMDALPDLVLIEAGLLAELAAGSPLPDTALEPIAIAEGYLRGRLALYLPELVAGIHGELRARDATKLRHGLQQWFANTLPGQTLETLTGPIPIPAPESERSGEHAGSPAPPLVEAAETAIERHCDPLSLSIVTRTRFDRCHLLERLLASITRAAREDAEIEVVLASDAPRETAEAALAELAAAFPALDLRLALSPPEGHSRVTNLVAGLRAARGAHVAVLDDDDHVDLFAFQAMRRALFLGARPLMVTDSVVHDETWERTASGRHQLVRRAERARYPAAGWRRMFEGVNRLPVCALVMPRHRLLARLDRFTFDHDLSEDYALHLLVLTDPALPAVAELPATFGHISMRAGEEHSMSREDRRPWVRDIALYLADLTRNADVAGPGNWALLAGRDGAAATLEARAIADLQAALAARERELRLMRLELDQLHAARPVPAEPALAEPALAEPAPAQPTPAQPRPVQPVPPHPTPAAA